jgi:hypothetical protein
MYKGSRTKPALCYKAKGKEKFKLDVCDFKVPVLVGQRNARKYNQDKSFYRFSKDFELLKWLSWRLSKLASELKIDP